MHSTMHLQHHRTHLQSKLHALEAELGRSRSKVSQL